MSPPEDRPAPPDGRSVRLAFEEGRKLARVTLDAGKGNVIGAAVTEELRAAFAEAAAEPMARAVLLQAAGPHFSFGASVEEHRPPEVRAMLARFHAMLGTVLATPLPVLAAVRGQCLGGGLELALCAGRIFAHPGAKFGQPEVKLAVFAPAASVLLPPRVGQAAAELLLLSGKSWTAAEALRAGLVEDLCGEEEDPASRAAAFARESFFALSPASLRVATRAARGELAGEAAARLAQLERLYLDEVAESADGREGIAAFLEKRPARWAADRGAV